MVGLLLLAVLVTEFGVEGWRRLNRFLRYRRSTRPDPLADAIKTLSERISRLEERLGELDGKAAEGEVRELKPKQGPTSAGG